MIGGRRRRRGRTWKIIPVPGSPGLFSLTRDGRQIFAAVPEEVARRAIRSGRTTLDKVISVEPDGYETNISKKL